MTDLPLITMIATGGTIATRVDPILNAPVPALTGDEILESVPGLSKLARLRVIDHSNLPSPCIQPQSWIALQRIALTELTREEVHGVIITHGTDTIDQTAFFLDLVLPWGKPVVLTAAQRNSSYWDADGPRNLINSVRQILTPEARDQGVTVNMNHFISAARYVRKVHTNNVQAFNSGDAGSLGYVDFDKVRFFYRMVENARFTLPEAMPRVEIVSMFVGADGAQLRAAAATFPAAIVVDGFGLGHVNEDVQDAIALVLEAGIHVVVASKIGQGRSQPFYGYKGAGRPLEHLGAIFAGDLSADKARVLAMLVLAQTNERSELRLAFDR